MTLILFFLILAVIFLGGVFIMAVLIEAKYGDSSAAYPLYAVRDRLIESVVFGRVKRDDPWLEATYEGVNMILRHSSLVAGIGGGWRRACHIGTVLAEKPHLAKPLPKLPAYAPPDALVPVLEELNRALDHLAKHHAGWMLQVNTERREKARLQRKRAKEMQAMLRAAPGGFALAA